MKYKYMGVKKRFIKRDCLDSLVLDKISRYLKLYGTKIKQNFIDEVAKDRNVFGREIKGIDLGRMNEAEYMEFCEQNKRKIVPLAL
jgi:hypothetical protein